MKNSINKLSGHNYYTTFKKVVARFSDNLGKYVDNSEVS